ncbi:bifunctional 4-hydroxy-2-oxoglutarate aldolase/2-dehydro-3-deoxy-phosphogluconate aldolase [Streptomyces sp. NPDC057950]|uniref:bifunctional 4-hydroxy-2-oxoglutarate aldolase/2-dehydro-3-deoxy-phosphogluconate aldolase n=1 Tax=Streptomyces sp. NPDC057950 TaxID=3346288 RepID=UPI0036E1EDE3
MDLQAALAARRLLAIVRGGDADAALRTVLALAEEGVDLIEVSLSGTDALTVIERARHALGPDALLGAGTVLSADDAHAAHRAGATFVVTPGLGDGVRAARDLGLPVLAGVLTPTDVIAAGALGAEALKLFPAAPFGGADYLKALRGPFPDVPFVPVGGIDESAAHACLTAGATAVGVGSPLVGDAADGGSLAALRDRARAFRAIAEESGR